MILAASTHPDRNAGSTALTGDRPIERGQAGGFGLSVGKSRVDEMDWALLRELQDDARLSFSELSRRVHLSPPAVAERVRRLEESGVIIGYRAHVDLTRAGVGGRADPDVLLRPPACCATRRSEWPEILEIHRITGDACSVLKVAAVRWGVEGVIDRLAPYGRPSSTLVLSSPLDWQPLTRCRGRASLLTPPVEEGPPLNTRWFRAPGVSRAGRFLRAPG